MISSTRVNRRSRLGLAVAALALLSVLDLSGTHPASMPMQDGSNGSTIRFKATPAIGEAAGETVSINLERWSTDVERAEIVAALNPPPAEAKPDSPEDAAAKAILNTACTTCHDLKRVTEAQFTRQKWMETISNMRDFFGAKLPDQQVPPLVSFLAKTQGPGPRADNPMAALAAAIGRAPTIGFIWTNDRSGYSIKYAYRTTLTGGMERIILASNRRLTMPGVQQQGSENPSESFTVIEMRIDRNGSGEAKASFDTPVVAQAEPKTLVLENYAAARILLREVRRQDSTTVGQR